MSEPRHIVAFSGGKDSSALAIYLHDPARWQRALGKKVETPRTPLEQAEYVFCDTGTELQETYDYLDRLEAYLGKPIRRLQASAPPDKTPFDHYLELYGGFLPSANMRWCTRMLKLKPFEDYVGDEAVINYVGIRADEPREGYISTKPNIRSIFPFKEDGIAKEDVYRILEDSGVGLPAYYQWRSRSGCYFCFFQRKSEWVGLLKNHPELFERAKTYEKTRDETGTLLSPEERFTWADNESLDELAADERIEEIEQQSAEREERLRKTRPNITLMEQFYDEVRDLEDDGVGCNICHL